MPFQRIGRLEDIPPGQTKFYTIGNKPVLLANYSGQIFALSGICPHQKMPLDGATLWDNMVDCPWHHFQYDVATGENHFPKNVYPEDLPHLREQVGALESYRVELQGDEIWVNLE